MIRVVLPQHLRTLAQLDGDVNLEIEGPIHVSNVAIVCPKCSQPSRIGRRREDGNRIRVCKKCGNDID